jgi:hypothetical protein
LRTTPRQLEFLRSLVELYHDSLAPLHYSTVADRLGVSKWSAYDMMLKLERQGLVQREYARGGSGGPPQRRGRFAVVFRPTVRGEVRAGRAATGSWEEREWSRARERILGALERLSTTGRAAVQEQLMRAIPRQRAARSYCAHLITALLLGVDNLKGRIGHLRLLRWLVESPPAARTNLLILAGLSGGLSPNTRGSRKLVDRLTNYVRKYESYVRHMSATKQEALLRFLREVIGKLSLEGT